MAGVLRTVGHPVALAAIRGDAGRARRACGAPRGATRGGQDDAGARPCGRAPVHRRRRRGRPCRACRGCRLLEHGNHPDLHRLAPGGAGQQIAEIGGKDVREFADLVSELALMPRRGRLAGGAHRGRASHERRRPVGAPQDARGAARRRDLILCADDEDRLLPTVRSRCVIVRLGPVPARTWSGWWWSRGLADAPTGARLARLTGDDPAWRSRTPPSPRRSTTATELVRTLLDLLAAPVRTPRRGSRARDPGGRAGRAARAEAGHGGAVDPGGRRGGGAAAPASAAEVPAGEPAGDGAEPARRTRSRARVPAAERRRALGLLIGLWRDLARDLAVVGTAGAGKLGARGAGARGAGAGGRGAAPGRGRGRAHAPPPRGRAARRQRQPGAAARRAPQPPAASINRPAA